ncbi:MAG: hypothetical protein DRJ60_06340 [Thermoprotei archaeon]|nr:MAG: hypothetical protein DRJ60_06340 [Thermoprotei archaeon]
MKKSLEDRIRGILSNPEEHLRKSIEFLEFLGIRVNPETILAFIAGELCAEARLLYLMKYERGLTYVEEDALLNFLIGRMTKISRALLR